MISVVICVRKFILSLCLENQSTLDDLKFKWKTLIDEWIFEAPLLLSFLQAVEAPPRLRNKKV